MFSIHLMKDTERRAILTRLIETREARAKFQKKTGYSKGRITQLLDKNEPFGERAAENVARRAGLALDFFENPEAALAPDVTKEARAQLLTAWGRLSPEQRTVKLREIQAMAATNLDIANHISSFGLQINKRRKT